MVLAGVDEKTIREYKDKQKEEREARRRLESLRDVSAKTKDGVEISLQANIELAEDIKALKNSGAKGVGLYRTEFLYIDRDEPATEAEQLSTYRKVIRALKGYPLTIRTLIWALKKNSTRSTKGRWRKTPRWVCVAYGVH